MARILIGMSGGVDSAVAASILKRDAHDVVGVTLLFDDSERSRIGAERAADICEKLGTEHRVVDQSARYEEAMGRYVASRVADGLEPSLAAVFTSQVLIPALFELADAEKIRQVATGHYAGTVMESGGIGTYPWRLMRGFDKFNDQSFMLYHLTQDELNRLVFPLAQMQEMRVRVDAMRQGLMMPEVPHGEHLYLFGEQAHELHAWLEARGLEGVAGDIIDLASGKAIGSHEGLHHHMLGEKLEFANPRAGMPVAGFVTPVEQPAVQGDGEEAEAQAAEPAEIPVEPETIERYVVAKDVKLNAVYVGSAAQAAGESCTVRDVFWTSIHPIDSKRSCRVRFSREDNPRPCALIPLEDGKVMMSFTLPQAGLASGKTVVFYSDDMVLGGGVIE